MDDLISRRVAIDRINKQREHLQPDIYPQDKIGDVTYRICAEFIARLPSAQPEIIRCKECKHRDKYGCCKYWKGLAMGDIPIATDDYDFCSYAEQKGEQCDGKL